MKIYYGVPNKYINITKIVLEKCRLNEDTFLIDRNDKWRTYLFGDPCFGIEKHIIVELYGKYGLYNFNVDVQIKFDIVEQKLENLHSRLKFIGGNIEDEYEEQIMALKFITPKAKVLELGSNIGRNSLIISSILEDSTNLVTLETDPKSIKILKENRYLNKFSFHIINAALSKIPLYQKDWVCLPQIPEGEIGYTRVDTIDYQSIQNIFGKTPDTLVADCEGALYYIFTQFPELLDDINLIIMENDYTVIEHKNFVDKCLIEKGFKCIYQQELRASYTMICQNFFYQTWSK